MTVHFTSDLHFGHRLVAGHRGFDSVEAHDDHLCTRWREVVQPGDIVWVLGDLAVSNPSAALEIMAGLPGRKRLVAGNHDKVHPMHRDAPNHLARYLTVFESVASSARVRLHGREALLSHFPYERDRGEPRYLQWRLPDYGVLLLHGHTHGQERLSYSRLGTPELHVGVDAWELAPVCDDRLIDWLVRTSVR